MSTILITVGAQADASFTRVFAPLLEASGRARVRVVSDAANAGKAQDREFTRVANKAKAAYAAIEAASAKAATKEIADAQRAAQAKVVAEQRGFDAKLKGAQKAQADQARAAAKTQADIRRLAEKAERESLKISQREAAQKDRLRQAETRRDRQSFDQRLRESKRAKEREEREILRDVRNSEKAQARQGARDAAGGIKSRGERIKDVVRGTMQNMAALGGAAATLGKDGFRAAGVNFDVGTLMQRGIDLEKLAAGTTISAKTAKGETATPEDVKATVEAIKAAGNASGQDFGALAQGLDDFVAKSTDLEMGKAVLADIGKVALATGTDVGKLVSMAGDLNRTLGKTPDKQQKILALVRMMAKQGALGNVEVKDIVDQAPVLMASAFQYEGNIDDNIGMLGGMAQTAIEGGAKGPAEAARAANSFARDVTKGSALKRFEKSEAEGGIGLQVFADAKKTKIRSPEKIITEYLRKTGGSIEDLSKYFQNDMSKRLLMGYSKMYNEAGGGDAGIKAIEDRFALMKSTMSDEQVNANFATASGGKAVQAQKFQNKLDELGMDLADRLLPALMKLTPTILALADAFVSVTTWAAENPGKAIVGAIIGSIGKAMIGNAIGSMLAQGATGLAGGAMTGVAGSAAGAVSGGAAAMTAALGPLGAALAAGALAIGGVALAGWQLYELSKSLDENSASQIWKKLKSDVGAGPSEEEQYQASKTAYDLKHGALPPPGAGQPAGAPPTLTAPAPNPVPTLQTIAAGQAAQQAALDAIAKNTAASNGSAPGVTTARTGPSKK